MAPPAPLCWIKRGRSRPREQTERLLVRNRLQGVEGGRGQRGGVSGLWGTSGYDHLNLLKTPNEFFLFTPHQNSTDTNRRQQAGLDNEHFRLRGLYVISVATAQFSSCGPKPAADII